MRFADCYTDGLVRFADCYTDGLEMLLGLIWVPSLCTAHFLSSSTFSLRRYLSFLFPILSIVSLSHIEISMFWNKIRYFSLFLLSPFVLFVFSFSLVLRSQVLEQNGSQFSSLSDSHSQTASSIFAVVIFNAGLGFMIQRTLWKMQDYCEVAEMSPNDEN